MFMKIETRQGQKVIVNLNQIISVWESVCGYIVIEMPGFYYEVEMPLDEFYEKIK